MIVIKRPDLIRSSSKAFRPRVRHQAVGATSAVFPVGCPKTTLRGWLLSTTIQLTKTTSWASTKALPFTFSRRMTTAGGKVSWMGSPGYSRVTMSKLASKSTLAASNQTGILLISMNDRKKKYFNLWFQFVVEIKRQLLKRFRFLVFFSPINYLRAAFCNLLDHTSFLTPSY